MVLAHARQQYHAIALARSWYKVLNPDLMRSACVLRGLVPWRYARNCVFNLELPV